MRPIVSELTGEMVDPAVFHRLAAASNVRVIKASLMYDGSPVVEDLPVIGGSYKSNRLAAIRSICSVDVPAIQALEALGWSEGEKVPRLHGFELVVKRGIRVRAFWPTPGTDGPAVPYYVLVDENGDPLVDDNGALLVDTQGTAVVGAPGQPATERYDIVCPCGVFPIQGSTLSDKDWIWTIKAADRSWKLDQAKLENAISWTVQDTLEDRIAELVSEALGDVEVIFGGEDHSAPRITFERETSPLQIIHDQAVALGYQAYFDTDGRFVWEPEPEALDREVVAEIVDGEGGVLISTNVSASYEGTYNKAIATSSAPDITMPLIGVAVNDNPASPTQYGGPYGKAPVFVNSPHIRTQTHATRAAATRLGAVLDRSEGYTVEILPHPALIEGDVIHLRRELFGVDEVVVIDEKAEDWRPDGGPDLVTVHPPFEPTEEQ